MRRAAALVVLSGALVAVQARLNGELGERLDDAWTAALVSFATGWALLVVLVASRPVLRRALRSPRAPVRWWYCIGGFGGAFLVGVAAAGAPVLGVALLTVGLVAGQTGGSLAVDRVGLGPSGRHDVTAPRVVSVAIALGAILLAASDRPAGSLDVPLLVLAVVAGVASAWQTAVNGRLREASGESLVAALVNFTAGLAALAVGAAVLAGAGELRAADWPGEPWLYAGGALGVIFIAINAWAVKLLGVLRLVLLVVAGQLIGATVVDAVAPAPGAELTPLTLAAALLTLAAVAVAGIRERQAAPPAS